MILLALAKIVGHLEKVNINTRRTTIFQYTLPTVNYLTSPRRNSLPPSSHQHSRNIQRLFTNNPEIFKDFSSTTRKCSKHFHQKPENIQRFFGYKIVLAANHQQLKVFKDFFACKIVLAAIHQYSGNIQRLFIINPEIFKDFFACKIVLAAKYQHPKRFRDFFARKIVLAAIHQYSGNIQRLFINNPKIFKDVSGYKFVLAANHQHPKIFKDFFACKIVVAANHQYSGNIQRFSGQQQPAKATGSNN